MTRSESQYGADAKRWLLWGYILLGALLVWRLVYISSGLIELSPDEALYWLQSKHPALSYYSKPPLTALTMLLGTSLFGDNDLGVRFFSPVIAAIIGVVCLRFCARELSARLGFALVLISNATPLLMVGSNLMTIDPLSVLFWTLAMLAGWRAIQPDGTTRHWAWVGVWMGLGFLSKYTALFQWLCWAVFFALWRPSRLHLRRPGPYLAFLVNLVLALPVLVWNSKHHWVTVTHVGGRADFAHISHFTTRYLTDFIASEFALLNPVFFAGMVWAGVAFWRTKPRDLRLVYFFSMGVPLVFAYTLQSLHARVLPNWIVPAVLPLMFVMVIYWDQFWIRRWVRRTFHAGLAMGLLAMIFLTDTGVVKVLTGHNLPVSKDPLHRIRGWDATARIVGRARQKLLAEGKPVFIICPDYSTTSEVTFYLPEAKSAVNRQPVAYCWDANEPITEFHFWPEYQFWKRHGDNAVFFEVIPFNSRTGAPAPGPVCPPKLLMAEFHSVRSVGRFAADFRGQPMRWIEVFDCQNQL
ncbi:MAG TPA: glycosyltransferase family 39 protein [Verrucomicrobiae bacterium]|nr:glycosyltransferase family 39 protein [Verrucomicrobiae bacterium]